MKTSHVLFALSAGAATLASLPLAAQSASEPSAYQKPHIQHDAYGNMNIVVPLTSDDKAVQGMKLHNLENTLTVLHDWGGKAHSVVVLYGKGVSLLKNPDAEMQQKISALKKDGVQFDVCNNTLKEQDIDFHTLYQVRDQDIVPSGFAEVAYLQSRKHYVIDSAN